MSAVVGGRSRSWRRLAVSLTVVAGTAVLGVLQAPAAAAHAQIVRSTPGDGANLGTAPRELTLTMSEAVELRYTRMTITDGAGRVTPLTGVRVVADAAAADAADPGRPATGAQPPPPPPGVAPAPTGGGQPGEGDRETPMTVSVELPALAPDLYRVAWTTVSSDDLHTTSGVIVFGVQTAAPHGSVAAADPAPGAAEVALRWAGLGGAGLAAGACLLLLLLSRTSPTPTLPATGELSMPGTGHDPLARRLLHTSGWGAGVAAAAGAGLLAVQAHAAGGGWLSPAAHLLTGAYGVRWLAGEASAVVIGAVALVAVRRPWSGRRVALVPVAGLALSAVHALALTLAGHAGAGAARHPLRVALEALHILAALCWTGALSAAVLVLWRPVLRSVTSGTSAAVHPGEDDEVVLRVAAAAQRRALLGRLGPVAAACVGVMVVTGLLLTGSGVASLDALVSSVYGRVLLVKLALVALATAAAAVTALSVHPRLGPVILRRAVVGTNLRAVVVVETVAALAVLATAGALSSAQPAVGAAWAPVPVVQPLASGRADDLVETVTVSPNLPGRNFVTVDAFDSRRPAPAPIVAVRVRLTGPDGTAVRATAAPQGDGRWLLPTDALAVPGRWQVEVQVDRRGMASSGQRYDWVVADPAGPGRRPLASTAPLAPWLDAGAAVLATLILAGSGFALAQRSAGRRRVSSNPPSGASSADTAPPNASATAATSASPSPVPGSSPGGWR